MRVSIVNNNLQSRAHGNGSDHSLIKVGGGYVSIVGNRLSLSWVNTLPYTLPTSKVAKFVEYTADAPLVHVEGNNFAQATAVEAIDVALISTLASANDHCVMNNIGNTAIVVRPEAASVHRTSLGLGNIATLDANTASKVLTTDEVYNALAEVTLTDAATIAVDMNAFINAIVTLADNRTLGQPSNAKIGQTGRIRIVQDGSGNRTLGYHADWKFESGVDPTLTTTAGATDILFYDVIAANFIYATLIKGIA